jgi:hypothetical protein
MGFLNYGAMKANELKCWELKSVRNFISYCDVFHAVSVPDLQQENSSVITVCFSTKRNPLYPYNVGSTM